MSPVLEERMLAAIGDAKTCPHGHPIDVGAADRGRAAGRRRARRHGRDPALRERGRGPAALPQGIGLEPGLEGTLVGRRRRGGRRRAPTGGAATVTASVAETVSVLADPSPPPRVALPEQLVLGRERYGR